MLYTYLPRVFIATTRNRTPVPAMKVKNAEHYAIATNNYVERKENPVCNENIQILRIKNIPEREFIQTQHTAHIN